MILWIVAVTMVVTFFLAKPIGAYQLGESYARNMGVNVKALRIGLILLSSMLSACVTAFAGPISFVGIAVPHLVKLITKTAKPIIMIPGCFLCGAVVTLFCDGIARTVFASDGNQYQFRNGSISGTGGYCSNAEKAEEQMMELRTENLVVGYDKAPLIKDVNLKVVSGQVLTLIGPNGAGKSTILKTITRQLKRIGGTIYLGQESMNNMRDSDVSKSLSMVMTERLQTELLTGRDVVASGRYPYTGRFGILSKEDWEKVDEAIALVHAQDVQDQDFRKNE